MHSSSFLPVFRSAHHDALLLLEFVLRAVLLRLNGVEHLLLLLRRNAGRNGLRLSLLIAFLLLVGLRGVLLRVALLLLVVALPLVVLLLVVFLLIAVLPVLTALLLLVLVFVLILVVTAATAAVLVVVDQTLGVGVVVFGLLIRGIQPQRLLVAFERFLVFLLLELRVSEVVEGLGALVVRAQRIGRRMVCSALSNRSAL